ncbi:Terminal uridylyltransferase 4 [Stylophora pistillata]|uniref:Terminal uridylyltransferase 4 n=1 Tax=Stylophora pistillata TaxID=50429 RepID=A0A2B4RSZ3_STYPI|nr:Terminal uridylyltransferase 4 [Stylophora pistillata]
MFEPKTSKLDEAIDINQTPIRERPREKSQVPDYGIQAEDDAPDMNLGDLFEEPVLPQNDKQILPKPRSYDDIFDNKEFYVDPQYFKEQPDELPPQYDEDEVPDYEIDEDEMHKNILNELGLQDYENFDKLDDVIRMPANGQAQSKVGYKFSINDRSSFFDWYNAYFEVQFQLQKLADGTAYRDRATVINGAHSLIQQVTIKSGGKIVYDTDNLHKVINLKNLLECSDDYSRSVAKNSLRYLDADHRIANANQNIGFEARRLLTTGNNNVNVDIPLNRYSFFEELEDRMLPPMQLQFTLTLLSDANLVWKAAAADDGRVVINRFLLWVPRLIPKDTLYQQFLSNFMKVNQWFINKKCQDVHIKPTKTQMGSGIGTILASIGISMAIDLVKNIISGKGAPRMGGPPLNGGKGAPRLGAYMPQIPPPFIGSWPNSRVGRGGALFDIGNSHSIGEMVLKGLANSGAYLARQGYDDDFNSWVPLKDLQAIYIDLLQIMASKTSCLLKKYCDADSRVHKLVVGLRYWARICSIDCQSEGGLPGYSMALMVIQFLQVTKPPVLPTWAPHEAIDEVNQKAAENFVSENQEEIGTLWYQLFRFYCIEFDFPNLAISIKDPRPVKREDKKWGHRRIAMEDPFSTKRNVALSLRSNRGSNTEIRNTSSKSPHKKNDSKSVKTKKQESKAAAVDEDIFQMDDLDPLTTQMRSMDVSSNDCEDGGFSQRQIKKKGSSLKSKVQDDAEIEVEISLSGSKEDDNRNSKTDSEEQACGVADKSKDIVYRFDAKIFQGNIKPVKTCCICKKDGHVKDRCPDMQKPFLIALPPMTPMFAKVLDSFCQTCRADFELKKSEVSNREEVLRNLESYINKQYPDPFNLDHNLGAGVTKKMANYILTTFIRGRERFGVPQCDIPKQSLRRYFFQAPSDSECGKIGHIAKGCPLAKANRRAEQRKEKEERKLGKEAGEKMNVKQMPFGAGSVRPRSASAPSKEGLNKNVDDSMHLPSKPSRQGAKASDVILLLKSQPDSQDLSSPPKGSRGIQSRGVADKLFEIPNMKIPDDTLLQGSPSVHSATPETLVESKEGISQPIQTSHISVAPGQSMPQSQGNSLQHTIGTHMGVHKDGQGVSQPGKHSRQSALTGEQFISLFRAAEEEVKKEDIPPTNPPANDEFESMGLHIAPKNLKAAKTPEEHQLLSKLSKVKSLWEGNATAELQSSCSAPVPVKELNSNGHTELQESEDAIASFQDTEVTVKEETCTTVTENVIRKKDEGMMVDKVDSTESVSEKPNGTAPSTQGHNEVASRRVSTEEQHLSTHEVTLKGKSEANATTVDKGERKRAEEQEEPIETSATQVDAPRKKNARRGRRGRKAKTQRQNEVIESPLNEQEKTGDDGTKERKNTQVQNQRQKNRVDFKVDAAMDSPSSSSKRPGSERAEEKQSGSSREGPRHGAESSKNSTPKKLRYERSKVKPTDSPRDPFGRGADSNQISTPKRPRSKRPKEKPSESSRDLPRRDAESNKNTRRGSERSEAKSNESSIDDFRRGAEPSQMSTPQKPRSERSEERPSQSPGDDPHRGAESTLSSNKHKESSSSKKEPGKRAPQETKKDPEKRAPQETKKEPGKGAPQETKKDPEKRAP